jgi:transposase InsO family protein
MRDRRARLTPFGRLLLVQRVKELGWTAAQAAAAAGVSRATAYKWLARFQEEGAAGLEDRSTRPLGNPRALSPEQVERIIRLRRGLRHGPHRLAPLLAMPRSTIYDVLRRTGFSRLHDLDRTTAIPIRYVRERPGELLHVDIKKLGRIPPGGGHRILGREQGRKTRLPGIGYDYLHVHVDDATRTAAVVVMPDDRPNTCAQALLEAAAWFADRGVRIERVMTDRAPTYTWWPAFPKAVASLGAVHKTTRPYRPQTNGKAERFIQTLLNEWAYARPYRSNEERLRALSRWLRFYNQQRPHTELGNQPPQVVLVNHVLGNYT